MLQYSMDRETEIKQKLRLAVIDVLVDEGVKGTVHFDIDAQIEFHHNTDILRLLMIREIRFEDSKVQFIVNLRGDANYIGRKVIRRYLKNEASKQLAIHTRYGTLLSDNEYTHPQSR